MSATATLVAAEMDHPGHLPVIGPQHRTQTAPLAAEFALRVLGDLAPVLARRIRSSVQVTAPLSEADQAEVDRILAGLSMQQLHVLSVLAGHVVTAAVTRRRELERESR